MIISEEGQGLMEYALLIALIAIIVIAIITAFGDRVDVLYRVITAMGPLN